MLRDALRRHAKWPIYADFGWPDYADSRQPDLAPHTLEQLRELLGESLAGRVVYRCKQVLSFIDPAEVKAPGPDECELRAKAEKILKKTTALLQEIEALPPTPGAREQLFLLPKAEAEDCRPDKVQAVLDAFDDLPSLTAATAWHGVLLTFLRLLEARSKEIAQPPSRRGPKHKHWGLVKFALQLRQVLLQGGVSYSDNETSPVVQALAIFLADPAFRAVKIKNARVFMRRLDELYPGHQLAYRSSPNSRADEAN